MAIHKYPGKISVIMPAYNEGGRIYKSILETAETFKEMGVKSYEIILVSDGSTDLTVEEARRAAKKLPHHVIIKHQRDNYGKGRVLKHGFRFATGDLILFLDADLDLHPAQTHVLFDLMQLDDADVVIGSKRHPNSIVNYPASRRFLSTVYFFFVKVLFGLHIQDTQTGIKLFKREVLEKVFPRILVKRYAYDLEMLALAHYYGYRIAEAPVTLHFQRSFSRVTWHDAFWTWWDTMAVFYRLHLLHYYQSLDTEMGRRVDPHHQKEEVE